MATNSTSYYKTFGYLERYLYNVCFVLQQPSIKIIHTAQVEWLYHLPGKALKWQSSKGSVPHGPCAMSVLKRWLLTWQDLLPLSTSYINTNGPRAVLFTDIGNYLGDNWHSVLSHSENILNDVIMHEIVNLVMIAMIKSIQMPYFLYVVSAMRDIIVAVNDLKIYGGTKRDWGSGLTPQQINNYSCSTSQQIIN